jgi:hypothetical protein
MSRLPTNSQFDLVRWTTDAYERFANPSERRQFLGLSYHLTYCGVL